MQEKRKKWYKRWWGGCLLLMLGIILTILITFVFLVMDMRKGLETDGELTGKYLANYLKVQPFYKAEGLNNYFLGPENPKVTIVEFADFNCPLCANAFHTIRKISLKYPNDVKIIYRDFPNYENSLELAKSARCAGKQGSFWQMHDKFFLNQNKFKLDDLPELAKQIGLNVDDFKECLLGEEVTKNIARDYSDAENFGVKGTPTWFINGKKLEGDIPHDLFIEIIEEMIK